MSSSPWGWFVRCAPFATTYSAWSEDASGTADAPSHSALLQALRDQRLARRLDDARADRIAGGRLYAATSNVPWATLFARTFDVDVKACAQCRGRLEVRAVVTDHDVARKILDAIPVAARAPPSVDSSVTYEPLFA